MTDQSLPTHARAVVIGAGIAGCSVAYHLAKLGWRDIVVIDQGPLFETGGSTTHAPGGVFQINASRTMTHFARYTVDLWSQMELDGESCVNPVGSLEVAWTPERLVDLKRKLGYSMSWGVEAHLITTQEARKLVPMLSKRSLGALYVPSDIQTTATKPAEAMAREATRLGASFHGGVEVTGFDIRDHRVTGVRTSSGNIKTDLVVSAVGIWAPKIGDLAGVPIPLSPMQHIYAITEPLPELAGATTDISLPLIRHQDRAMYFRQERESFGIGSYLHEPLIVDAEDILDPAVAPIAPAEMTFTANHFKAAYDAAGEVMPALKGVGLTRKFNGLFSFNQDGFPILGEAPQLCGFWSAQAVWITHAGGVGKAVAEWIVNGEPTIDLHECDIARFHPHAYDRSYVKTRSAQLYREVYDIVHPLQQPTEPRNVKVTPFHERHKELGAEFFEDSGWERPRWYAANEHLLESLDVSGRERQGWEAREWSPIIAAEHAATRQRVAMFDLTPFAKFEVSGSSALHALQHLSANQIDRPIGAITYTSMLTPSGGIKCDLTVTRLGEDRFMIVTGGGMSRYDLQWIQSNLPSDFSVNIADISSDYCCIGLWGPDARHVLSKVTDDDVSNSGFPYMTTKCITLDDVPALALRISYAGELGWEIYAPTEHGQRIWDLIWEAGEPFTITAAGTGAFDSLRIEKGYRLWGNDIHTEHNPFEAGIEFAVKIDKGDFIGKTAMIEARSNTPARRLTCMTLNDPSRVVMGNEPILDGDRVLGYVTSANYGHTTGRGIAYGYLSSDHANPGNEVDILYFGERLRATVRKDPLYDPEGRKLRS